MIFELFIRFKDPLYGARGWYKFSEHATKDAAEFKMQTLYDSMLNIGSRIVAWRVDAVDLEDVASRCTVHQEGTTDHERFSDRLGV